MDVIFTVSSPGHTEDISAHRFILAMGSSVFHAMFFGGLAEKSAIICIPDVEPDAFRIMIRYLYTEEIVGMTIDNVMATLYCAKKYLVRRLIRHSRHFVQANVSAETACMVLSEAAGVDEPNLEQIAILLICHMPEVACQGAHFLSLSQATMRSLLGRDDLAGTEYSIYQAARRWSVHQAEQLGCAFQAVLAEVLPCVRLPHLEPCEIVDGPHTDDVLSHYELKDLYRYKFN